jgi:hypothetical protein
VEEQLTKAQREAVAIAKKHGRIWSAGRGRFAISGTAAKASDVVISRLVDKGILVLSPDYRPGAGVMPYYTLTA